MVDVYHRGMVDSSRTSYFCFRIPALARTAAGALIAFAEARRSNCGDSGDVRIVRRVSHDDGATWSAIDQVKAEAGHTVGNPCPIVDRVTKHVHLLFSRDNREVFTARSIDGGLSWGPSTNLTSALGLALDPSRPFVATGPPGGIQIEATGRLVGAMYYNGLNGTRSMAIFSDDHGSTWRRGADVPVSARPIRNASSVVYIGGEAQVANYPRAGPSGLLMVMRVRGDFPSPPTVMARSNAVDHNTAVAISANGGLSWTAASLLPITSP